MRSLCSFPIIAFFSSLGGYRGEVGHPTSLLVPMVAYPLGFEDDYSIIVVVLPCGREILFMKMGGIDMMSI